MRAPAEGAGMIAVLIAAILMTLVTIAVGGLIEFGGMMSDAPTVRESQGPTIVLGIITAALYVAYWIWG